MFAVMSKARLTASILLVALFGVSGVATADGIEISGTAKMGIVGTTEQPAGTQMQLLSDVDLQIRMSRTTDSGLTFAVEWDLDDLDLDGSLHGHRVRPLP
jgi:hypothetical protein